MDTYIFEELLKRFQKDNNNPEEFWDMRAESFENSHKSDKIENSEEITRRLFYRGLLKNKYVLDIGGGTGRYAIPFAEYAKKITVADVSLKMLEYARKNAESNGLNNLEYIQINWNDVDLLELGWKKKYDLVFSSMCEGTRSKEGLLKMSAASKGWCQVNQLIEMQDSLSQKLIKDLSMEIIHDVHNNREIPQALFNILWLEGYSPEIGYIKDFEQQYFTVDNAFKKYSPHFNKICQKKNIDLKNLLEQYADKNRIHVERHTTLSVILWKT